jgi:hypothetical protein
MAATGWTSIVVAADPALDMSTPHMPISRTAMRAIAAALVPRPVVVAPIRPPVFVPIADVAVVSVAGQTGYRDDHQAEQK